MGDQEILFKENLRERIEELCEWIPSDPARQSFDPQRVRARVKQLQDLRVHDPDHPDLLPLLAEVFLRLDRCERYPDMVAKVKSMGTAARPVCEEIVGQIAALDLTKDSIRNAAVGVLREWDEEAKTNKEEAVEADTEQEPLLRSFHQVMGIPLLEVKDQAIYIYMRQARKKEDDIRRGLRRTDLHIPDRNRKVLQVLFEGPDTIAGFS